jgi:DNA adenine methylase
MSLTPKEVKSRKRPLFLSNGGKFVLAKKIVTHFPVHRVYCEPFAGAGSVFFQKESSPIEVLNDINSQIVNIFRVVRNPKTAKLLQKQLEQFPYSREEMENSHAGWVLDPVENAARYIARSFLGRGRASELSGFRVSFKANRCCAKDFKNYPQAIGHMTSRLKDAIIEKLDAIKCIEKYDTEETLFYVDPPYVKSARADKKRDLYEHEIEDDYHEKLLGALVRTKGAVILSGYDHPLYRHLQWRRMEIKSRNTSNKDTIEVLWIKD